MQRICAGSVSTHALREESDKFEGDDHGIDAKISIHALREESDQDGLDRLCCRSYFNPRPPRGERPGCNAGHNLSDVFQSTPSARRATQGLFLFLLFHQISIHALREEGDRAGRDKSRPASQISIHALRGESDPWLLPLRSSTHNFNPRPPRGERLGVVLLSLKHKNFNPRPPRGGRPAGAAGHRQPHGISIHALREEGDSTTIVAMDARTYFNPRPPRGGRPRTPRFFC